MGVPALGLHKTLRRPYSLRKVAFAAPSLINARRAEAGLAVHDAVDPEHPFDAVAEVTGFLPSRAWIWGALELLLESTPVFASERFFLRVPPLSLLWPLAPMPAPLLRDPLHVLKVHEPAQAAFTPRSSPLRAR